MSYGFSWTNFFTYFQNMIMIQIIKMWYKNKRQTKYKVIQQLLVHKSFYYKVIGSSFDGLQLELKIHISHWPVKFLINHLLSICFYKANVLSLLSYRQVHLGRLFGLLFAILILFSYKIQWFGFYSSYFFHLPFKLPNEEAPWILFCSVVTKIFWNFTWYLCWLSFKLMLWLKNCFSAFIVYIDNSLLRTLILTGQRLSNSTSSWNWKCFAIAWLKIM